MGDRNETTPGPRQVAGARISAGIGPLAQFSGRAASSELRFASVPWPSFAGTASLNSLVAPPHRNLSLRFGSVAQLRWYGVAQFAGRAASSDSFASLLNPWPSLRLVRRRSKKQDAHGISRMSCASVMHSAGSVYGAGCTMVEPSMLTAV